MMRFRILIFLLILFVSSVVIVHDFAQTQQILSKISDLIATVQTSGETDNPENPGLDKNPHLEQIQSHEREAGMPLQRLARLLIQEEGYRDTPYLDTVGAVTIGVGRSLSTNGLSTAELNAIVPAVDHQYILNTTTVQNGRILIKTLPVAKRIFQQPLTHHDVQLLLTDDLKSVTIEAKSVFGTDWEKIDDVRKEAILDVLFNTGLPHFKKFVNFIESVKKQNWEKAATDLLMSQAARTHIARYHRIAYVVQSGKQFSSYR